MNHLPEGKPEYVPGYHPIEFQPLCYQRVPPWKSACNHWKHPLQRFDRHGSFVASAGGAHHAVGGQGGERAEPAEGVVIHHFQYRDEDVMRAKLELICGSGSQRLDWMRAHRLKDFDYRLLSLDAVYSKQWSEVRDNRGESLDSDKFFHWNVERIPRWYLKEDLSLLLNTEPSCE